ncbi:MAG: ComEC/Rec2 family competence protein [Christensenellales bacterium]
MKRFFNFRPLLFAFIGFMSGIFACIMAILGNILPVIFCAILTVVCLVLLIFDLVKKDSLKKLAEICGTKRLLRPCFCMLLGIIVGASASGISFAINNFRPFKDGTYTCVAEVSEVANYADNQSVLLKNVTIDDANYNFNIKLTVNSTEIKVGNKLSFTAKLFASSLVQNGKINTNILKSNIKYYGYIYEDTLQIQDGKASLIDLTKDNTKNILLDSMDEQNAGFAFATLVGDKTLLSSVYYDTFKNAGLAHILAVSGLHVGFLVAVVIFILNACKLKKKHQFFVVAGVLFIYCLLCDFSPSIFRASVMSLCLMLGMVLGEQNDSLSNLSLAGIIVLLSQPLYLYDVGFLLSFGSVFGILILSKQTSKLLEKIKLPKAICDLIAVTISATLGTIPAVFSFFGEISLISIFSNLIVLPLFSIMFVVLLACTFLNFIFPLPFLMSFAEFFINIVVSLSAVFAKFQTIKTFSFDAFSGIIYYVLLFAISRFCLINLKSKMIVVLTVVLALSTYVVDINTPVIFTSDFLSVQSSVEKSLFLATKNNQKVLINVGDDEYDAQNIANMLKSLKVNTLDYLLLFDYKDSKQSTVCNFVNNFKVKNIVAFGRLDSSTKVGLATGLKSNKNLSFCEDISFATNNNEIKIDILYINDIFKASNIAFDEISILKIENSLTANQISKNSLFFKDYDLCFAKNFNLAMNKIVSIKFICNGAVETDKDLLILDNNTTWSYNAT